MIFTTSMSKFCVLGTIIVLACFTSACAKKYTYSHSVVQADEVIQKQLIQAGEKVSIYTTDGNEYIMYLHHYDSEVFIGYVLVIHEKGANRYEYFDEKDGVTEHLRKIQTGDIDEIGLYGQSSSSVAKKGSVPMHVLLCLASVMTVC